LKVKAHHTIKINLNQINNIKVKLTVRKIISSWTICLLL